MPQCKICSKHVEKHLMKTIRNVHAKSLSELGLQVCKIHPVSSDLIVKEAPVREK